MLASRNFSQQSGLLRPWHANVDGSHEKQNNKYAFSVFVFGFVFVFLGAGTPRVVTGACRTVGIVAAPVTIGTPRITFNRRVLQGSGHVFVELCPTSSPVDRCPLGRCPWGGNCVVALSTGIGRWGKGTTSR